MRVVTVENNFKRFVAVPEMIRQDPTVMSWGLWISTLTTTSAALVTAGLAALLAVLNTATSPRSKILSDPGVYFINILTCKFLQNVSSRSASSDRPKVLTSLYRYNLAMDRENRKHEKRQKQACIHTKLNAHTSKSHIHATRVHAQNI